MVPYVVGAVVAVTVINVLLFVLHVCATRLLGWEGDGNAGVGVREKCGCGECVYGLYTWFRCFG